MQKLKLLGPDIFRWGGGDSKPRKVKDFLQDISGFWLGYGRVPEKLRKIIAKNNYVQSSVL